MKGKKFIGIIVIGIFFILMGIYSLGNSYFLHNSGWDKFIEIVDGGVQGTINGLEVFKEEEYQKELEASGNSEQFKLEYNNFTQQLLKLAEEYKLNLSKQNRVIIVFSFLTGILFLISGFALIRHFVWARSTAFLSIFCFSSFYISTWRAVYPMFYMLQFVIDGGNKLNLLVNATYTDLAERAGRSVIQQLLFGFPLVLVHLLVLIIVMGILYYLTRPSVSEQFK